MAVYCRGVAKGQCKCGEGMGFEAQARGMTFPTRYPVAGG